MSRVARLGAFIVLTMAILVAGVFVIGSKEYLFSSTYRLRAKFDNVAGLAAGADVQVGGVHSGTVHSIELPHKPGDQVTVVIDLDRSTREIIRSDSVASIETAGVLGNQYLAISFGSKGQAEVKDGDLIQSEPPLESSDLFKKTSGILDSSQKAINNATLITAHLNSVSAKIDSGQGTVGALVNDKKMYSHLADTTETLQSTMQQAQIGVTDFQENMEALKHNFFLSGYFKKRGYNDSADLNANRIEALPLDAPAKTFTVAAKQIFDSRDSAKLKNQKALAAAGEYLSQNQYAFAVVVVSAGAEGDSQKMQVLTDARAMVVREYLVENFGFDDSQLKTFGMGKQTVGNAKSTGDFEWGSVEVLVFPVGTEMPVNKAKPNAVSNRQADDTPIQAATTRAHQP